MSQKDIGNKIPIYKLKTTEEVMKYYDEWGEQDKYNKDMLYGIILALRKLLLLYLNTKKIKTYLSLMQAVELV